MTAFEELQATGQPGTEVVAMLISLAAQEVRTSSFPPPSGHRSWDDQAVMDHVATLFTRKNGLGFIAALAVQATDQRSLERLTLKSIRRDLIDEAKATPVGKLRRRLRTLFGKDGRFDRGDGLYGGEEAWVLPTSTQRPWAGTIDDLDELAAGVTVEAIESLPPAGPTPAAARTSLVTLSHEGLRRADAAVRAQLLARFLARRFGLDQPIETTGHEGTLESAYDEEFDDDHNDLADEIYDELSDEQRWLVTALDTKDRISARLGGRAPQAAEILRDRLRPYASTQTGRQALEFLARRCDAEFGE